MISSPSTWADTDAPMEIASESCLIREACLVRDIGQRRARAHQEILGAFNPSLHEPPVSRDTESGLERPRKVTGRKAALPCQLREAYSARQILAQQLCCTPLLPRAQAAGRYRGRFSQSCVVLEHMSAKDQAKVVQRERT